MDLSQVKARLNKFQNNQKKSDLQWKPELGSTTQIRIVPYKGNPNYPFIELYFHYQFNKKTYLSPKSFGRPDPIVEFADKLKSSGDKEDWKAGRALEPKMRTFVPVIVRGKEDEGVKFWGFGKTVYEQILGYCADTAWGDIEHPIKGRDLTIEYNKPAAGQSYPTTVVRPRPDVSRLHEDDNKIKEMVTNQPDITELYDELSYEELKSILSNYLGSEDEGEESSTQQNLSNTTTEKEDGLPFEVDEKPAETKTSTKVDDVAAQFDDLFNS